jgi:hypothetical protein
MHIDYLCIIATVALLIFVAIIIQRPREGYMAKAKYTNQFLDNTRPNTNVSYDPPIIQPTFFENEYTDGPVEQVTSRQRDKYGTYIELDSCKYLNEYPNDTYGRIGEGLFRGYASYSAFGKN